MFDWVMIHLSSSFSSSSDSTIMLLSSSVSSSSSSSFPKLSSNVIYGVSEGSVLGPSLINIDLRNFVIMSQHDITDYADDNTPYVPGKKIHEVVKLLEEASRVISIWVSDN